MQEALAPFVESYVSGLAQRVADFFSPVAPADQPARLYRFLSASNEHTIQGDVRYALRLYERELNPFMDRRQGGAWNDLIVSYWHAVVPIIKAEEAANQGRLNSGHSVAVYESWKDLTDVFIKNIAAGNLPAYVIFTLYFVANNLRKLALKADEQLAKSEPDVFNTGYADDIITGPRNQKLEEAARVFNRIYALCLGDRNPNQAESRKWGVYCIANLQFKTYFKLKNIGLSKNVIRTLEAQADLPPFELFPPAHRVTYSYYTGVLAFLQEDYAKAEKNLQEAWDNCLSTAQRNKDLILMYLIPCRLIAQHKIPSRALLAESPHLERLFAPLLGCIKRGDLTGFDEALANGESEFARLRIFLTLERGRDIALRNLLRKVYLAAGFEDLKEGQTENDRVRKSRVPLSHFVAAFKMNRQDIEVEEIECLLCNQFAKGHMKGYISREHAMVVVNKRGVFPGTGI